MRPRSRCTAWSRACRRPTCTDGSEIKLSNALEGPSVNGGSGYTWYGFSTSDAGGIVALSYAPSGVLLSASPCTPILVADRPYDGGVVKDAAVVKFRDCYVMVYTGHVPEEVSETELRWSQLEPGSVDVKRRVLPDADIFGPVVFDPAPQFLPPDWLTWKPPWRP